MWNRWVLVAVMMLVVVAGGAGPPHVREIQWCERSWKVSYPDWSDLLAVYSQQHKIGIAGRTLLKTPWEKDGGIAFAWKSENDLICSLRGEAEHRLREHYELVGRVILKMTPTGQVKLMEIKEGVSTLVAEGKGDTSLSSLPVLGIQEKEGILTVSVNGKQIFTREIASPQKGDYLTIGKAHANGDERISVLLAR